MSQLIPDSVANALRKKFPNGPPARGNCELGDDFATYPGRLGWVRPGDGKVCCVFGILNGDGMSEWTVDIPTEYLSWDERNDITLAFPLGATAEQLDAIEKEIWG